MLPWLCSYPWPPLAPRVCPLMPCGSLQALPGPLVPPCPSLGHQQRVLFLGAFPGRAVSLGRPLWTAGKALCSAPPPCLLCLPGLQALCPVPSSLVQSCCLQIPRGQCLVLHQDAAAAWGCLYPLSHPPRSSGTAQRAANSTRSSEDHVMSLTPGSSQELVCRFGAACYQVQEKLIGGGTESLWRHRTRTQRVLSSSLAAAWRPVCTTAQSGNEQAPVLHT